MAVKNPVYDNDYVTLAYLKQYLGMDVENGNSNTTYSKNYGSQPVPPYYKNDTWTNSDGMYVCVKDRLIGNFVSSDWELVIDTKKLNSYVIAEKLNFQDLLKENTSYLTTYYQNLDPSLDWDTSLIKERHIYNMWRPDMHVDAKIYVKLPTDPVTYTWMTVENTPSEIWNTTSGIKHLYSKKPTNYSAGDLWLIAEGTTSLPANAEIGDWAVALRDGTDYSEDDWTIDGSYVSQEALNGFTYDKEADLIETLKYDLANEGRVDINGNNITVGSIKSQNYLYGASGMKIDLINGTMDSKNFKVQENGDLNVSGYIQSSRGILTNLYYKSDSSLLGLLNRYGEITGKGQLRINVYVPNDFEVVSAVLYTNIYKTYFNLSSSATSYGKVNKIKLYKINNNYQITIGATSYDYDFVPDSSLTEVSNAFAGGSYTAPDTNTRVFTSNDIASSIPKGSSSFVLETSNSVTTNISTAIGQTQYGFAVLNLIGYLKRDF